MYCAILVLLLLPLRLLRTVSIFPSSRYARVLPFLPTNAQRSNDEQRQNDHRTHHLLFFVLSPCYVVNDWSNSLHIRRTATERRSPSSSSSTCSKLHSVTIDPRTMNDDEIIRRSSSTAESLVLRPTFVSFPWAVKGLASISAAWSHRCEHLWLSFAFLDWTWYGLRRHRSVYWVARWKETYEQKKLSS